MTRRAVLFAALVAALFVAPGGGQPPAATPAPPVPAGYHRVPIGKHTFTLPVGFTIELVAETPQVDRPVVAAFDDKGRLFVADSSGSNAKPADQLKDPTHRIVMLESTKKDGRFDKSTVFADKLSFLQGTMWHAGSLYVATPPTIQKLTDTDGDGKADKREVWFDGGVLTGCANDVHGPYHGPGDGRIYWTKGAFAKQEVTLGTGKKFVTRAAHIYSAKPDGTDIRVEMTGGMDNPVDVAFASNGETFFTTTFFQHPANGKRDGLVHSTYGAVYGKEHDPVQEHVRTRPELSEPMTHLGPAAPAGLHCYRSRAFGAEYRDNLFACQFNLAKVSRHVLKEKGATYATVDSDFVTSDNRDFHPTDVIEDADGSLLVVDTGGWYRLCCPSSVMEKKDLLGGIYRVRKDGVANGHAVEPTKQMPEFSLKSDSLRERRLAAAKLGRRADAKAVPVILDALADEKNDTVLDTALTRALIDIGDAKATAEGLKDRSPRVRRAAFAALASIPGGLTVDDILPHLGADDPQVRQTIWWIAGKHPDWGGKLVEYFAGRMKAADKLTDEERLELAHRLSQFAKGGPVQKLLASAATADHPEVRKVAWRAMAASGVKKIPDEWQATIPVAIASGPSAPAFDLLRAAPVTANEYREITDRARNLARLGGNKRPINVVALHAVAPPGALKLDDATFRVMAATFGTKDAATGCEALGRSELTGVQLEVLAESLNRVGPLDLPRVLPAFTRSADEKAGLALVAALSEPKVRATVRADQIKPIFDKYPKAVQDAAAKLYADLEEATKEQRRKLDTILADAKPGDVRRGQAVFLGTKAACSTCHKVAYVGGLIGPDLTKIGSIRTERDLLESVVFPSATFVRSYEPVKVETKDGRSFNGILKKDAPDEVVLTINATDEVRLARKDIDEIVPGTVSVMPAGLDQQLTPQELADLVAFLKSLK